LGTGGGVAGQRRVSEGKFSRLFKNLQQQEKGKAQLKQPAKDGDPAEENWHGRIKNRIQKRAVQKLPLSKKTKVVISDARPVDEERREAGAAPFYLLPWKREWLSLELRREGVQRDTLTWKSNVSGSARKILRTCKEGKQRDGRGICQAAAGKS